MEIIHRNEALKAGSHVDNGTAEGKATVVICDPWNPPYPLYYSPTRKSYSEWCRQRKDFVKTSRATSIITPDRTPEILNSMFYDSLYPRLLPILEKDSVVRFLRLYAEHGNRMTSGFIIIPEAFNHMIAEDARRCAKVALEGKAPELEGCRANPNYMNQYGYFPLHEAAERFSVKMIKLLLSHGASTNVRTAGTSVIEDLLPLHVAVEDTCLHKYLEDNLLPKQEHLNCPTMKDANYVYKIIHLLCLPEMKIFLDTARLLAKYTNNLVDEILNYIKDGKLLQTAVLLLAAQAQIRVGSNCVGNGNSALDGFDGFSSITARFGQHMISIKLEMCRSKQEEMPDLEAKCEHLSSALLLVKIISQAGKALDSYIGTHQEVPHTKVLERVSQILNDHGFFPTGEGIGLGNLCPYRWCPMPNGEVPPEKHGNMVASEAAAETPLLYPADKRAARSKLHGRWEREYAWNSFFPYWRSVLSQRCPRKATPAYAQDDALRLPNSDHVHNSGSKSFGKHSMSAPNDNAHSLARRTPQGARMNQSSRLFGTVAMKVFKVLKNA